MPDDASRAAWHDAFVRGAHLFDHAAYFEAHEAWEERWLVEPDAQTKRFLQALIQIAAGLHKLVVVNDATSAARLVTKGLAKLDACPAAIAEARVEEWHQRMRAFLGAGELRGAEVPRFGV